MILLIQHAESRKRLHELLSGHVQVQGVMTNGCRYGQPLAVVVTTGFATCKGDMLRRILHPVSHRLSFMRDALFFILFMLALGFAFYAWSIVNLVRYKSEVGGSTPAIQLQYLDAMYVAADGCTRRSCTF